MERTVNTRKAITLRESLDSVERLLETKFDVPEFKQPLLDFIQNFKIKNSDKKINLTFFGNPCAGKTTLINLFIRHLITQRLNREYSCQIISNQKAPSNSNSQNQYEEEEEEEEEEGEKYDGYLKLCTKDIENTFFICSLESSDSEAYEIILEFNNEEDKQVLGKSKFLQRCNLKNENQFIMEFLNNQDGITEMNKFLSKIDHECLHLIQSRRKKDLKREQQTQEEYFPSNMTIKNSRLS